MRVYKYAVIFYIALFLTGTFAPYILNYSFNFNRDYIQNELNSLKDKRKKIIFFGSSHCEFGIKSEIISKKFNVISHNFCSDHWDKDKKIFTQIYNNLNENDIFNAFKIVGEFLDKSILRPNNISFPSGKVYRSY